MSRLSVLLLGSTTNQVNVAGDPVHAAAYYDSYSNLHTIAVYLLNFTGRLYLEGTLASNPVDGDWAPIKLQKHSEHDYIEFEETSDTLGFNFKGNFIWLRARIDRTYLEDPEAPNLGRIDKILLNF